MYWHVCPLRFPARYLYKSFSAVVVWLEVRLRNKRVPLVTRTWASRATTGSSIRARIKFSVSVRRVAATAVAVLSCRLLSLLLLF